MTKVVLAGAIALGGLGAGAVGNLPIPGGHVQSAEAESAFGVSINASKSYWTTKESIGIKVKNDNNYEVRLIGQLEYYDKGSWVNKGTKSQWYALPDEKFGIGVGPEPLSKGSYRYRMAVYRVTQPETNYDGTFVGHVYTSNFYVN